MVSSNAYPRIPTDLTNFGDTALDALPRSSVVGEQVEEHETDPDGLRLRAPRSLPRKLHGYLHTPNKQERTNCLCHFSLDRFVRREIRPSWY